MIIRPAKVNLKDVIDTIDKSKDFSFGISIHSVYTGWDTHTNEGKWVDIVHLDMLGPVRYHSSKYKNGKGYTGPLWKSEIYIYPSSSGDFEKIRDIYGKFAGELPGVLSDWSFKKEAGPYKIKEAIIRYDFDKKLQPSRKDSVKVIPHLVYFTFREDKIKDVGKHVTLQKWSIGDLAKRILFPPGPYHRWTDMEWITNIVEEQS